MTSERLQASKTALLPLMLIVSLFFLWGVANNLNDVLIPQFRKAFSLNDLQSSLVQSAFYFGYFVCALPAALVMRRFGYKAGVVIGLGLFGLGALLFYPAAEIRVYEVFLGALFVIASGLAFLETSANPLMTVLGPPATGAFRLNLAQAFNPLGSITAILVGRQFIFSGEEHSTIQIAAMGAVARNAWFAREAHAVQTPYLILALVVLAWAAVILVTRFPAAASAPTAEERLASGGSFARLAGSPRFMFGVVAQFFYVGAQVGVWSFMIRYAERQAGAPEKTAATYLFVSLIAFAAGRFIGSMLMRVIRPERICALFAAAAAGLCLVAVLVGGKTGLYALVATSFFMSIMFPTIFASAIADLGPAKKIGAAFVVMAIIGGAVLTAAMGAISDSSDMAWAMAVPAAAFLVVLAFAIAGRATAEAPAVQPALAP